MFVSPLVTFSLCSVGHGEPAVYGFWLSVTLRTTYLHRDFSFHIFFYLEFPS